ncbi:MAG: hypothetical protein KA974_09120 [Saprospiraceae bacterium]|nr:hypothetical protein [Saprospiraceae bacterium]MBP7699217.1 hypothetical protein [Saprospiraceae bacterium]
MKKLFAIAAFVTVALIACKPQTQEATQEAAVPAETTVPAEAAAPVADTTAVPAEQAAPATEEKH